MSVGLNAKSVSGNLKLVFCLKSVVNLSVPYYLRKADFGNKWNLSRGRQSNISASFPVCFVSNLDFICGRKMWVLNDQLLKLDPS